MNTLGSGSRFLLYTQNPINPRKSPSKVQNNGVSRGGISGLLNRFEGNLKTVRSSSKKLPLER